MTALAGIATLAFILAGTLVGVRLFRLSRRTDGSAERNIGLGLVWICAVAYPCGLALPVEALPEAVRRIAFGAATTALAIGSIHIVLFVRDVFRPSAAWAEWLTRAFFIGWFAMVTIAYGGAVVLPVEQLGTPDGWRFFLRQGLMFGLFGWSALESALWWNMTRRRRALGLAEAEVVNRFALWAIAGLMSLVSVGSMTVVGLAGRNPLEDPVSLLIMGVSGLVSSATMVLRPPSLGRELLWGRVGRGTGESPRHCQAGSREIPGEPEVQQDRFVLRRDPDVVRLHIPVDDALAVSGLECLGDLAHPLHDPARPDGLALLAGFRDHLVEAPPWRPLHRQPRDPAVRAAPVDGHDVRVPQSRGRHGLPLKPLGRRVRAHVLGADDLDRRRAAERLLLGEVDDSHPPFADPPDQAEIAEALCGYRPRGSVNNRRERPHRGAPVNDQPVDPAQPRLEVLPRSRMTGAERGRVLNLTAQRGIEPRVVEALLRGVSAEVLRLLRVVWMRRRLHLPATL